MARSALKKLILTLMFFIFAKMPLPSIADLYGIDELGSIQDAWLNTVNLVDVVENSQRVPDGLYNFAEAREKISKVLVVAENHKLDSKGECQCGLSIPEHALLRRKILIFFRLQIDNLKQLVSP